MLYKRNSSPTWWVRFRINKREVRQSTGTSDRAKAEQFEQKLRGEAWDQTRLGVVRHTWDEAVERWLKERAGKRSIQRDKDAFEVVRPYLSGGALTEIKRAELGKLRQVLEARTHRNSKYDAVRHLAPATVLRLLATVRSVLRACVRWGWLNEAPLMAMPRAERGEPRFITREEFEKLYKELPGHLKPLARFSVETGARYGSATKLQWSAVDLKRKHAFIGSSTSKSKRSVAIPLNDAAVAALRSQIGRHAVYVFADHKQRAPIGSVKTAWGKAVERAALEGLRWHDLRHTWASWHTQNGTPPTVLRELGGWASLAMVERYSHLSAEHLAQWVGRTKAGTASQRHRGKELVYKAKRA
jgi:integrase